MWFRELFSFDEIDPDQVRSNLRMEEGVLTSLVNGAAFHAGALETPSLVELRAQCAELRPAQEPNRYSEIVTDARSLHCDPSNAGAMIQVASQFNLLEMTSPSVSPERGVDIYEHDRTQGPACAIAAGAGTVMRNYFADVNGRRGQTTDNQIDCLADMGVALGNESSRLWTMRNGYAVGTYDGLLEIGDRLQSSSNQDLDHLRSLLRVGIQHDTQVTLDNCTHRLSQVFCSALPVAYSVLSAETWERFARLVLEATYEATFCAAMINREKTGSNKLYLTLVGGGAFGNKKEWIFDAVTQAAKRYPNAGLEVAFVSVGRSNSELSNVLGRCN